ncbi:alpha/beta fold hydrolase [Nocardia sp. NBC_01327]|uniref:alpha/beta fold hydrolase n=1 Tax=Nocardia sp. NBC_01327 TaxID=2903593 RepID=UPI002E12E1E3|nr:alpha/beta hydrolase [Nocardia sp. NBC_01327]
MPFVARGGAKIHYTDTGGTGPALVLGHSMLMDQEMFELQRAELGERIRLICIDSRGHGRTEDDGTPFSYWDLARDAWAVADHLGIERVVAGGVAHGACTALRMTLLARPRTRGLIVIGSAATAMTPQRRAGYREVLDFWTGYVLPAPVMKMVSALTIGGTEEHRRPWREKWLAEDRGRIRQAADCVINRDSVLELLGDIDCPAMILRGVGDQATSPEDMRELAEALGGRAETHTIPGAAIAANLTHPEEVNALLRTFMDGLPA